MEKFVMAKTVHFGFLKQTFGAGQVIEVDRARNAFTCQGVEYKDLRDVDINIRIKFLVPHTKKDEVKFTQEAKAVEQKIESARPKDELKTGKMPIVQSDTDTIGEIDISWTNKKETPEASKDGKMKVVSASEEESAVVNGMTIVRQNEEGQVVANLEPSDNVKPINASVEEKKPRGRPKGSLKPNEALEARKKQIEANRLKMEAEKTAAEKTAEVIETPKEVAKVVMPVEDLEPGTTVVDYHA